MTLLFMWRGKRRRIANTLLKKTDTIQLRDLPCSFSNQDYIVLVKEKEKNISMEQNEEPEINSHKYNQLIFIKGTKTIQ